MHSQQNIKLVNVFNYESKNSTFFRNVLSHTQRDNSG